MFSKSSLEVFKEKALFKVQEQLEQLGVRNDFIESRANALGDSKLCELLKIVDSVSHVLETVLEAATMFHQSTCIMDTSASLVNRSLDGSVCPGIVYGFDPKVLRQDLNTDVSKPLRLKLKELADIKNRVREAEILRLELNAKREAVEKIRSSKSSTSVQIGRAEDSFAEKSVLHDQSMLRLSDELIVLRRDSALMVSTAIDSLKVSQYKFFMERAASLTLENPAATNDDEISLDSI